MAAVKGEVDGVQAEYKQEENGYLTELKAVVQAIHESMALIRSNHADSVKTFAVLLR